MSKDCGCKSAWAVFGVFATIFIGAVIALVWLITLGESTTPRVPWYVTAITVGGSGLAPVGFFTIVSFGAARLTREECCEHSKVMQ